ncbi:MAG: hypothetical protein PF445_01170 [Melioribacteraceae bacterium]|nr:hypothetical protein [Melioribacteraceae bacterium]
MLKVNLIKSVIQDFGKVNIVVCGNIILVVEVFYFYRGMND